MTVKSTIVLARFAPLHDEDALLERAENEDLHVTSVTPRQVTAMPKIESALGSTPNIASSSATAKIGVR